MKTTLIKTALYYILIDSDAILSADDIVYDEKYKEIAPLPLREFLSAEINDNTVWFDRGPIDYSIIKQLLDSGECKYRFKKIIAHLPISPHLGNNPLLKAVPLMNDTPSERLYIQQLADKFIHVLWRKFPRDTSEDIIEKKIVAKYMFIDTVNKYRNKINESDRKLAIRKLAKTKFEQDIRNIMVVINKQNFIDSSYMWHLFIKSILKRGKDPVKFELSKKYDSFEKNLYFGEWEY